MADDIFDKIWEQLSRIYNEIHDGLIPRADNGERQSVASAVREAFGIQDTARLSDTAAMDVREDDERSPSPALPAWKPMYERPTAERLNVEAPPVIQHRSEIDAEIRSALQGLGPTIIGAMSESQGATGLTSDSEKGDAQAEQAAETQSQLDRIADGIDRIIELLGNQIEATRDVERETREGAKSNKGLTEKFKSGVATAGAAVQAGGFGKAAINAAGGIPGETRLFK